MQTKTTSLPNSRPLKIRADLVAVKIPVGHSWRWVIKDPLSLQYFEFTHHEWFLMQQLDGFSSLEDIKERFNSEFAPQETSVEQLRYFFNDAYQSGLILVDSSDQGTLLIERQRKARLKRIAYAPFSLLGIRFPLGDSHKLLQSLGLIGKGLFHPLFVCALLLLMLVIIFKFIGNASEIASQLPDLGGFFSSANLWLLGGAWVVVKVFHELGHGLACRRFGGECHEFGIQFIVFMPFAYCDVSDAWMMPNKWHRIIVSAAGIYVELICATFAAYLWYFSEPGVFHSLMLNLVVLCTVNTLLFNGNPLLRFDGYYILSDWLEVPNLHDQAKSALWGPLKNWLTTTAASIPRLDGNPLALACFGAFTSVYRLFITGAIAWGIYQLLSQYKLRPLADLLVCIMLIGLVLPLLVPNIRFAMHPLLRKTINKTRLLLFLSGVAVGTFLVLNCPWDYRLRVPVLVQAQDAAYLYTKVSGQLVRSVAAGEFVEQGQEVGHLENLDLKRRLLEHQGRLAELEQQLAGLQVQVIQAPELAADIEAVQSALVHVRKRVLLAEEDIQRLTIQATQSGVVLDPAYRRSESTGKSLLFWEDSPLDRVNTGCHLESGDLLCLIGAPDQLEAILLLSQSDTQVLKVGTMVRMRLEQEPNEIYSGKITLLSHSPIEAVPPALIAGGEIAMETVGGRLQSTDTLYFVKVEFLEQPLSAKPGSTGHASITIASSTVGNELLRIFRRVFYVDLD